MIVDHDGTSRCESVHSGKLNTEQENNKGTLEKADQNFYKPNRYKIKFADISINFNPSIDTIEIDTDSFSINSFATFTTGKNKKGVKRQLAKFDINFLYDEKKGSLYFKENGSDKDFSDVGIIAILKGAHDLTSSNLEFI